MLFIQIFTFWALAGTFDALPSFSRVFAPADETDASKFNITYTYNTTVLYEDTLIYYIYYGTWKDYQKIIFEDFAKGLGSSDWWKLTQKYYFQSSADAPKQHIQGIGYGGSAVDDYSLGKNLSDVDIHTVVEGVLASNALPVQKYALYMVLLSPDVIQQEVSACGYHYFYTRPTTATHVYFAMIRGDYHRSNSSCVAKINWHASPNGDIRVDGMIDTIAHEITEAITDPELDAWYDYTNDQENADLCNNKYVDGNQSLPVAENGAAYNHEFGGRKWLFQMNVDIESETCKNS